MFIFTAKSNQPASNQTAKKTKLESEEKVTNFATIEALHHGKVKADEQIFNIQVCIFFRKSPVFLVYSVHWLKFRSKDESCTN